MNQSQNENKTQDKNQNSTQDNVQTNPLFPNGLPMNAGNAYDDDDIPQVDLPQDIIPDEVPRKDGPGGEEGK